MLFCRKVHRQFFEKTKSHTGNFLFQLKGCAGVKRYRYTGKERDEETGLYYHGARYYIPWLARWSAVDPLQAKYPEHSPYEYCSGNPIVKIDPNGESDEEVVVDSYKSNKQEFSSLSNSTNNVRFGKDAAESSPTFRQTLEQFTSASGQYHGVQLRWTPRTSKEINLIKTGRNEADPSLKGTTILYVKTGEGWGKFSDYQGEGSDIKDFRIDILINRQADSKEVALTINHELTIHAVKLAEIISQKADIQSRIELLRNETQDRHHLDLTDKSSLYNKVNEEMLKNHYTLNDFTVMKPLDASTELAVEAAFNLGEPKVTAPNASTYNNMVLAIRNASGIHPADMTRLDAYWSFHKVQFINPIQNNR